MDLYKELDLLKIEYILVKRQLSKYYWVSDYRNYVKTVRVRIKLLEKLIENIQGQEWLSWVNEEIIKKSGKPFKSGAKIGKVVEMTINPYSDKLAFKMCDKSIVDCHQCESKL